MAKLKKTLFVTIGALVVAYLLILLTSLLSKTQPLNYQSVRETTAWLNESAAWHVPHFELDDGQTRAKHISLFSKMESGEELSEGESKEYRQIYQIILFESQSKLSLVDSNLTVLHDHDMKSANNIGGHGIEGSHDHHDASIRSNLASIIKNLRLIRESKYPLYHPGRVIAAIAVHKDTRDIILHVGTVPQTVSTMSHILQGDTIIENLTESMLSNFKQAQLKSVNSPEYWRYIDIGMDEYAKLVIEVQKIIVDNLSDTELKTAGLWGEWQSLGSSPRSDYPLRRKQATIGILSHELGHLIDFANIPARLSQYQREANADEDGNELSLLQKLHHRH